MSEHFPSLPEATLAAANQLGAWLAQHDLPQQPSIDGGQCGDPNH